MALRRSSTLLFGLAAGCCLALMGCSRDATKPTPVTGKVLVDGKPAVGATVSLHPASGPATAARPVGQVDETGTFRLTTAEAGDGAPPGEYKVTVTWFGKPASKRVAPENDDRPVQNLLSPKYAKPESTPLTVTVSAEQTEPLTLDLKRN